MRALRLHAPAPVETRPLVLENVPDPTPGPGQILVKVSACGICRTDLHIPPSKLDAAIIFAPAGELIPAGLAALDKGGTLVLGGIHMSDSPPIPYELLYLERIVRSVANNTRDDGRAFLAEAARIPVKTHIRTFSLEEANDALIALKTDAIRGAGVLVVA